MLRSGVVLVLAVGLAGCGGGAREASRGRADPRHSPVPLRAAPIAVLGACRTLAGSRVIDVLCPARLPSLRWTVSHTTLRRGRCAYLLDLGTRPFGTGRPFHVLAGGRCERWPLSTRAGHWPARAEHADALGLIGARPLRPGEPGTTPPKLVRPRVLRRIRVGSSPGLLLLVTGYPDGGVHGGHLAAVFNRGGHGYVLSLHFDERPRVPGSADEKVVLRTAERLRPAA